VSDRCIGLMSGTSLDGVDAALVDFSNSPAGKLVAAHFLPYPDDVRAEALALNSAGPNELERAALLANRLTELYAAAALAVAGNDRDAIAAVGCHGQTVRHRPDRGYTLQLCNPSLLAERTGLRVVADFRSRDVAAGGHGAPLAPAYHAACFARPDRACVVVNLGGIANVTELAPGRPVRGFDTGPGNVFLDAWAMRHLGKPYDVDGAWARQGKVLPGLLQAMLAEDYFAAPPPKSTGRDEFNASWLDRFAPDAHPPADVQATLVALTARTIATATDRFCGGVAEAFLCGGGVRNGALVDAIRLALPNARVESTAVAGVDPDWMEAMAFAWLARQALAGQPGNIPEVTGAAGPRILGAIYPA
jgi:anhydro-N-acetylmuramic acid kinase